MASHYEKVRATQIPNMLPISKPLDNTLFAQKDYVDATIFLLQQSALAKAGQPNFLADAQRGMAEARICLTRALSQEIGTMIKDLDDKIETAFERGQPLGGRAL